MTPFLQGYQAHGNGVAEENNPHISGKPQVDWRDGWLQADSEKLDNEETKS